MKITKLGHCCLLIEAKGKRVMTDPGNYSTAQNSLMGVDFVLISHEHGDHFHVESLKEVMKNNPQVRIITNQSVGKLLDRENIPHTIVGHGMMTDMAGVSLVGLGVKHAAIYKSVEDVENTGYVIDDRLFYPGDAFTLPGREIDILALPVAGPWMKISEALEYALEVKPKKCFPVHDGNLRTYGVSHRLPTNVLTSAGIEFVALEEGRSVTF
ncbi:MAG: MBL fold metallo-hydrolase [Candidatus Paceibacterota bacterium]|jgi:L-ascorbate metabolism protein UlaG (beta-lactamase superfamily)